MDIGPNKTKIMTNNPNGFQREIKMKILKARSGKELQISVIYNEGSYKPEILSRPGLTRQEPLFLDRNLYGGTIISFLLLKLTSSCGPSYKHVKAE